MFVAEVSLPQITGHAQSLLSGRFSSKIAGVADCPGYCVSSGFAERLHSSGG